MAESSVSSCYVSVNKIKFYGIEIKKIDSTTKQNLRGTTFSLSSIYNNTNVELEQQYNDSDNIYVLFGQNIPGERDELLKFIPLNIKNEIMQIHSEEDLMLLAQEHDWYVDTNCCCDEGYCRFLSFEIPVKLVESRSPSGYQKNEYIIYANAHIYYIFNDDHNVTDMNVEIFTGDSYLYQMNNTISIEDYYPNERLKEYLLDNYSSSYECDGEYVHIAPGGFASKRCNYSFYPYFEDEKGEIVLKLDNRIEEKYVYETTSNKKVKYKIVVNNEGNASSSNNNVKISIPTELDVDKETISDEGIYDEDKREISWTIEYMDPESEKDLYFDIVVPNGADGEYKMISSISHDEVLVRAPETTLKISDKVNNPETGIGNYALIILLVLLISVILNFAAKKKRNYLIK